MYGIALRFHVRAGAFLRQVFLLSRRIPASFIGKQVVVCTVQRGISALFYIRQCFLGRKSRAGMRVHRPSYKKVKVCDTIDIRNRRAQEPRSAAAMSFRREREPHFLRERRACLLATRVRKLFAFGDTSQRQRCCTRPRRPPIAPIVAPNSFRRFRFFIYGVQKRVNRRRKYCFCKRGAVQDCRAELRTGRGTGFCREERSGRAG